MESHFSLLIFFHLPVGMIHPIADYFGKWLKAPGIILLAVKESVSLWILFVIVFVQIFSISTVIKQHQCFAFCEIYEFDDYRRWLITQLELTKRCDTNRAYSTWAYRGMVPFPQLLQDFARNNNMLKY